MLEFLAFATTLTQIILIRFGELRWSWIACLCACACWLIISWQAGLFWLGVQQLIIASLAVEALIRGRRNV